MASELREAGHTALVVPTDVRDRASVEGMVERTVEAHGRLDVLVNNAGGNHRVAAAEVTDSIWDRMVNLNLRGPFLCSQTAFPVMSKQGGGVIVNISSSAANSGAREFMPYGSAKAGLQQMTRMLAAEWAEYGIRVNCVAAGSTKTEGFIRGRVLAGLDPDAAVAGNAMGRPGRPEEDRPPGALPGLRRGLLHDGGDHHGHRRLAGRLAALSQSLPGGDPCVTLGRRLWQGRADPASPPPLTPTLSQRERGKTSPLPTPSPPRLGYARVSRRGRGRRGGRFANRPYGTFSGMTERGGLRKGLRGEKRQDLPAPPML